MHKLSRLVAVPLAFAFACALTGCTIYGEKKPPTLASTTSAEQYERILWQTVEKQQWNKLPPLFSTTLVWNADGKSMNSSQLVPYLQSLQLKDVAVRDVTVHPNGPDMTVSYTLELSSAMKDSPSGGVTDLLALSVWQQTKGGGWILIAHGQQTQSTASTSPAAQ